MVAVGTGIDPEFRVLAYRKSLTVRPLDFVQREIRRLYRDAAQCDRKLFAYSKENEGAMPLLTSDFAAEALVLGEKYHALAMELARRRVRLAADAPLGGDYFRAFFAELQIANERPDEKQVMGIGGLLTKAAAWVKRLF